MKEIILENVCYNDISDSFSHIVFIHNKINSQFVCMPGTIGVCLFALCLIFTHTLSPLESEISHREKQI